ncbi:MAG: DEAD/DEAH box helicase [Candidatus Tectomicrobia bacterium]|uniref:DEAD/DEAH box helicase n=1 Tax=Tectimicrobiota bacterium TaxID=2528274 RepID=A0A932GNH2_UNCTE|nr:DEAD/DEAH box helicase [Candidatus Tectomicrobia bacterium]
MNHLVFRPRPVGGPEFFLWGSDPGSANAGIIERLAASGRRATVRVVSDHGKAEQVRGLRIGLLDGVAVLARIEAADLEGVPASVAAWSLAAKLALDLVARERILPLVLPAPEGAEARWGVSLALPDDSQRFTALARAFPPAAHAVPTDREDHPLPSRGRRPQRQYRETVRFWAPETLLAEFLDATADALDREAAARTQVPLPAQGRGSWEGKFIAALTGSDPVFPTHGFLERGLPEEISGWVAPVRGALAANTPRVCLKLDPPGNGTRAGRGRPWELRYFLQAADDPSLLLPAERAWAAPGDRLQWMDRTFAAPQELLLQGLAQAARLFPPVERSLEAARPESVPLSDDEAWRFLSDGAPLLSEAGFTVLLPAELSPAGQRRLRLRMRVGAAPGVAGAVSGEGRLSLDGLVAYRWELALGDQTLSPQEFSALVALKRPLVQWRGEWVVLDPNEIAEIRHHLQKERGGKLQIPEALAAALGGTLPREGIRVPVEVVPEGLLISVIERLRAGMDPILPPADLQGTLRPYQERGLSWLALMARLGLGGCLADDMGLGKTVETIAFLLARRAAETGDPRPALIVCPTSVVGNWERELARFSPALPVLRHHGPERARDLKALRHTPPHAVVVTTYGLLRRDQALLGEMDWAVAVLDEAQNIKNAASRQAHAARALRATHRFALTGTPVENRLAELWSILHFCVPGLLGPLERFRRRFAVPIERYRDNGAAEELRRVIRPFVLRRLKSDPGILADLPPKQEMAVVCTLTREQATLYQAQVDEVMAKIEAAEGIQRRGIVLALLTALKQICNHPAHYLRERGPFPGRSGKLDRLTEMLEETVASGDRALVFTQFREMGDRLVAHLSGTLQREVPFLHGGVPRAARDAMVRRFQEDGPPVFVLSLKAGGTGLNLTHATRVFHFDRWWNPAVEDQATDRAHRIGQRRLVQVYRLLTAGTVEEKIDALLTDKRALAERIVGASEAWITELSDAELRGLFALSRDAVVADNEDETAAPAKAGSRKGRK